MGEPEQAERQEEHAGDQRRLLRLVRAGVRGAPADLVAEVAVVAGEEVGEVLAAAVEQPGQDQAQAGADLRGAGQRGWRRDAPGAPGGTS